VVWDGWMCGVEGNPSGQQFPQRKKNDLHDGLVELLLLSFFFSLSLFQCLAGGQAGGPVTARTDAPQCRQPGRVQWAGGGSMDVRFCISNRCDLTRRRWSGGFSWVVTACAAALVPGAAAAGAQHSSEVDPSWATVSLFARTTAARLPWACL